MTNLTLLAGRDWTLMLRGPVEFLINSFNRIEIHCGDTSLYVPGDTVIDGSSEPVRSLLEVK